MRKKKSVTTKKRVQNVKKKDPKKVAAGKARAAKAVRIGGKYASREFIQQLKEDAAAVGVSEKNVYQFFLQNEREYVNNAQAFRLTTTRNYEQILNDVRSYNGTLYYNGKKTAKAFVLRNLTMLNNYFKSEHNFYKWWLRYEKKLNGQIKITAPTIKTIETKLSQGEEVEDILSKFDLEFIQNTNGNDYKKSNKQNKRSKAATKKIVKKKNAKIPVKRKKREHSNKVVKKNKNAVPIKRKQLHGKNRK